jgi:hypothetical protein
MTSSYERQAFCVPGGRFRKVCLKHMRTENWGIKMTKGKKAIE